MPSDTSQRIHCAYGLLMKQCKMNLFYSSENKKYPFSHRRIFPIRTKFSKDIFWGELPLPRATTPCVVEEYVATLLPETSGTRVPVQIPDGYPGKKIPESPSTNCM